jgi:zinc transporter 2
MDEKTPLLKSLSGSGSGTGAGRGGHGHGHEHAHDEAHKGHGHGHEHGEELSQPQGDKAEHPHGHGHGYHESNSEQKTDLMYALVITFVFTAFQAVFALAASSLSMFADAMHHFLDCLVVLSALVAIAIAERVPPGSRFARVYIDDRGTKHHFIELVFALGNCALLVFLSVMVILKAMDRTGKEDEEKDVDGSIIAWFGLGSVIINVIKVFLLHAHMLSSLNVRAVYIHAMADCLGALALLVGGLLIVGKGSKDVDNIVAEVIAGLVILNVTWVVVPTVQLLCKGPADTEGPPEYDPEHGHGHGHDDGHAHDDCCEHGHEHGDEDHKEHGHKHGQEHKEHGHGHEEHGHEEHGHEEHGHGHGHGDHHDEDEALDMDRDRNKLYRAMFLCLAFMSVEIIGGIIAHSLAIITDAAHLLSDFASMAIGIAAITLAKREATRQYSFGFHRAEVIGALLSVLIIWLVTGGLVVAAVDRIITPTPVNGPLMFSLAMMGLGVNIIMLFILGEHGHSHAGGHGHSHGHGHGDEEESNVNVRAMYIHIIGDLIQAIGVIIAGGLIWWKPFDVGTYHCEEEPITGCTYWSIADPVCTMFFAVLVLCTTYNIVFECVDVIMQKVPDSVDCVKLTAAINAIENVVDVHDLHVWSMSAGKNAGSLHVTIAKEATNQDAMVVLRRALQVCEGHTIPHATIQIEVEGVHIHDDICHSSFRTSTVQGSPPLKAKKPDHGHAHAHAHDETAKEEHGHEHGPDCSEHGHEHGDEHGDEHGHGHAKYGDIDDPFGAFEGDLEHGHAHDEEHAHAHAHAH